MEKDLKDLLEGIKDQIELANGHTGYGDRIINAVAAVGTAKGKIKAIIVLEPTVFNHFFVDDIDMVTYKGYNVNVPALTMISAGKGKYITEIEIAIGGQIQIWE